jgi:hypothetical protein
MREDNEGGWEGEGMTTWRERGKTICRGKCAARRWREFNAGVRTDHRGVVCVRVRVCRVLAVRSWGDAGSKLREKLFGYGGHRDRAEGVPGGERLVELFGDGERGDHCMAELRETRLKRNNYSRTFSPKCTSTESHPVATGSDVRAPLVKGVDTTKLVS